MKGTMILYGTGVLIGITATLFSLVSCGIVIPQSSIQELVDKALIESLAQRQRDLLEEDEALLSDQDPEVTPGFFEGDIAGIYHENELGRVGINFDKFPDRRWPNNTVHYLISHLYYPEQYRIVKTALDILDFFTCIDFKEWDGKEPDYLILWPVKKPAGCWSYVGRLGGPQIVSLQAPDKKSPQCFAGIGRPLHEIMHALGVYHEQSRPDRDKYINVVKTNVIKGFVNNFDKLATKNVSLPFEYDYNSIMHYGINFFSVNRTRPTLVTKQKGRKIGQRINLSKLDCLKLNSLYGCLDDSNPFIKRKYETICDFLGLESTYPKKKSTDTKPKEKQKHSTGNSKSASNLKNTTKTKPGSSVATKKPNIGSNVPVPGGTTKKPGTNAKIPATGGTTKKPGTNAKVPASAVTTKKPSTNAKSPALTTKKPNTSTKSTVSTMTTSKNKTTTVNPKSQGWGINKLHATAIPQKVSPMLSTKMRETSKPEVKISQQ